MRGWTYNGHDITPHGNGFTVFFDGDEVYLGDSYYRTTKTQDEFMSNSMVVNMESCTMWLDESVYKKAAI